MSSRKSYPSSESITLSRRSLLRSAAVVSSALAGTAIESASAADGKIGEAKAGESPNMNPPVVQVTGGKLRGFRDGKTSTFLGIPYAEAERFEMPKPVKPWDGIRSAQAWGPVCPIPAQERPGADEFVFPHRFWLESEACQVLNIWTQNRQPERKEAGDGVDARRRIHQRLVDGVVCLRRQEPERVRRCGGGERESPAEHHRHDGSLGVWLAVRELALHGHGGPGCRVAVGAGEHRAVRRRPGQRNHLRPIRRRRQGDAADAYACGEGAVP